MDRSQKKLGLAVTGLAASLALGIGALVALWNYDGGLSYTEPAGNPSLSQDGFALIPAAERAPARHFAFHDADGAALTPAALKGKVVLVNLWATWCPPCIAEMAALDTLQGRLGGPGFQVVAVSLDRGGKEVVERWFGRNRIAHLSIFNADSNQFDGGVLPTSFLLDAQGRVAWQGAGQRPWDGAEAEAAVKAVMAEGAPKG